MKKLLVLTLSGFLVFLGIAGSVPAYAYPELTFDLTVDRNVLPGGEPFTATGTSNVPCRWTIDWNGAVRSGAESSAPYATTFTAPVVMKVTKIPLHGECTYESLPGSPEPARTGARTSVTSAPASWKRTIIITVLPAGVVSPPGDELPNTGGPALWMLLTGLGLAVAGGFAVRASKRT